MSSQTHNVGEIEEFMATQKGSFQRRLCAKRLQEQLPVAFPPQDSILSNREAAAFLNCSERTLNRISFPSDLDGPTPIRYTENGNVYWSRYELEGFVVRKQLQAETKALRSVQQRSFITDLVPYKVSI
jgi:hypothetical protein